MEDLDQREYATSEKDMQHFVSAYIFIMNKLPVLLLILLASLWTITGDYAAKAWSVQQHFIYLIFAFASYFLASFFYIPTLLRQGLIVTSTLWVLLTTIGFLLIGVFVFKESLSTLQICAVVLGIISIFVLSVSG